MKVVAFGEFDILFPHSSDELVLENVESNVEFTIDKFGVSQVEYGHNGLIIDRTLVDEVFDNRNWNAKPLSSLLNNNNEKPQFNWGNWIIRIVESNRVLFFDTENKIGFTIYKDGDVKFYIKWDGSICAYLKVGQMDIMDKLE